MTLIIVKLEIEVISQYSAHTFFDEYLPGELVSEEEAEVTGHLAHEGRSEAVEQPGKPLGFQNLPGQSEGSDAGRLQALFKVGFSHGLKPALDQFGGTEGKRRPERCQKTYKIKDGFSRLFCHSNCKISKSKILNISQKSPHTFLQW